MDSMPRGRKPRKVKVGVPAKSYPCAFCGKVYKNAGSAAKHQCRMQTRFNQSQTREFVLAHLAFTQFFKNTNVKTDKDSFMQSLYYNGFFAFGQYVKDIKSSFVTAYVNWLTTHSVPLAKWISDEQYDSFLQTYILNENAFDAIQRSIENTMEWSETTGIEYFDYFRQSTVYSVFNAITTARISPWMIFCSASGRAWLLSIPKEELSKMWNWIDPEKWTTKINSQPADQFEISNLLKSAGF